MPTAKAKSKEQQAAEVQGFREALGPFVVAAQTTRMPMVFTDAKIRGNPIIFANDSFLSLTGHDRAGMLGRTLSSLMGHRDDPASSQIEAAFAGSSGSDLEVCFGRKDRSVFWASIFISPVRDEAGNVVQHFVSFVDFTRRMQEAERLRFLLNELDHRTQNTLATVQAIAVQTLRGVADSEAVQTFEGRILALSKAHTLMGRENWDAVSLSDLINKLLGPFGLSDRQVVRFSVGGDEIRLQSKTALTLALVFHELATNAVKHGALSNGFNGQVDISWRLERNPQGEQMHLKWQESGGPAVTAPERGGFGSRLIEGGLAQDLNGEVSLAYQPEGVVCQILMPLAPVTGGEIHE